MVEWKNIIKKLGKIISNTFYGTIILLFLEKKEILNIPEVCCASGLRSFLIERFMLGMQKVYFYSFILQQSRGPYSAVHMAVNRLQAVHLTVSKK